MSRRADLASLRDARKKSLVVGLGLSGVASAKFLARWGLSVVACEKQPREQYCAKTSRAEELLELERANVEVCFGIDGEGVAPLLSNVGLAVLSPGVPLNSSIVKVIRGHGIPLVSELELGVELHGGDSIVVTGSNGKSTTATLIDYILRRGGISSHLCGNVGTPVIANPEILAEEGATRSVLVVEASSYQLEASLTIRPIISVVLNISENHLERHGSLQLYAAAKAQALARQDATDLAILNADDPIVMGMRAGTKASVAVFGARSEHELSQESDVWARVVDPLTITFSSDGVEESYSLARGSLMGVHNCYNAAAAIVAARRMGVPAASIQECLDSFLPLEHRLESVPNSGRYLIFNDSKSTTVAATVAAFSTVRERYPGRKLSLMVGGFSKAGSWEPLMAQLRAYRERLLPVICFGKDGPLIAGHCRAAGIECREEPSLALATDKAVAGLADNKDSVLLLSPGCASFDEFSDFEHRGREFKSAVARALGA